MVQLFEFVGQPKQWNGPKHRAYVEKTGNRSHTRDVLDNCVVRFKKHLVGRHVGRCSCSTWSGSPNNGMGQNIARAWAGNRPRTVDVLDNCVRAVWTQKARFLLLGKVFVPFGPKRRALDCWVRFSRLFVQKGTFFTVG